MNEVTKDIELGIVEHTNDNILGRPYFEIYIKTDDSTLTIFILFKSCIFLSFVI